MKRYLKTRTAVVSGGLGDIGRAIALELARNGANVALGDVRPASDAAASLRELESLGVVASYDAVDVSDATAVSQWVGAVEQKLGLATIVIPNAAIVAKADLISLKADDWSRQLRVNLDGAFHLAQAAVGRLLHHRKPGHIVFLGSWVAQAPHPVITAYCVAKAGLRMLCQCLALELAPHAILVNEVAPGFVDAGVSKQIWDQNSLLREEALRSVPVGKLISPAEVARQVVALCHPDNHHITGSVVLMDGGLSLRR